jgi:hypothetical protein
MSAGESIRTSAWSVSGERRRLAAILEYADLPVPVIYVAHRDLSRLPTR